MSETTNAETFREAARGQILARVDELIKQGINADAVLDWQRQAYEMYGIKVDTGTFPTGIRQALVEADRTINKVDASQTTIGASAEDRTRRT